MFDIIGAISQELKISRNKVEGTVRLLDENHTIPFIARYRKEITGSLNEEQIRNIKERLDYLRNLNQRKEEVIRLIEEQGKLTVELKKKIEEATILQQVEDLYRPFRPKKQSRAQKAKEKGLEPLAEIALAQELTSGSLEDLACGYLDEEKELNTVEDVLQGMRDIIAEYVSDDPDLRKKVRNFFWGKAFLVSSLAGEPDSRATYKMYYDFREPVKIIPPHRIMAINRGEKDEVLKVKIEIPDEKEVLNIIFQEVIKGNSIFKEQIEEAIKDGYKRLLGPSLEREIRSELSNSAEEQAIRVFARNLRNLLLTPPVKGKVVLGIDPAFRTGCKVAVVDPWGKLLATATIYPHEPQKKWDEALKVLNQLSDRWEVDYIAIGNGTASRETEELVAKLINTRKDKIEYIIVDEAGASVYSASRLAKEEFPQLDVAMRGAVSIARRLQDPLAELVKIEPRSIGVGLYQHDVSPVKLDETLKGVVESCVNYVGVDLNTASSALLQYVAGINKRVARNIVKYREENGPFTTRKELLGVSGMGEKTFLQCAGFLRIPDGENPFANTPIHPESYGIARQLMRICGFEPVVLKSKNERQKLIEELEKLDLNRVAGELDAGLPTLKDIVEALKKPGRDPRESLPKPIFRKDILKISDLKPGLILTGTVRNVVDFGAFVDIGVKQDGLVHISELSEKYVRDPLEVVEVGDIINVKVLSVDEERGRISLSMKGLSRM